MGYTLVSLQDGQIFRLFKYWWVCYMFFCSHIQYNFNIRNQKTLALDIFQDWDSFGVSNSVDSRKVISLASEDLWGLKELTSGFCEPRWATCSLFSSKQQQSSSKLLPLPHRFRFFLVKGSDSSERGKCYIPGRSGSCLDWGKHVVCKHWSLSPYGCVQTQPRLMVSCPPLPCPVFSFSSPVWMVGMTSLQNNWVIDYWLLA